MRVIAKDIHKIEDITRVFLRFEQELEPFNSADPSIDFIESDIEGLSTEEIYSKAAIRALALVTPCFDRVGWSEEESREIASIEDSTWVAPRPKLLTIQGTPVINLAVQTEPVAYAVTALDQYNNPIIVLEDQLTWTNQTIKADKVGEVVVKVSYEKIETTLVVSVIDEEVAVYDGLTPEQREINDLKKQVADLTLVVAELIGGGN